MANETYWVGETVYHDGNSSFCDSSYIKVTKIKYKYDENTGKKYQVVVCGDQEFDARTGHCIKGAKAYFIGKRNKWPKPTYNDNLE